jgi:hypothetical protein
MFSKISLDIEIKLEKDNGVGIYTEKFLFFVLLCQWFIFHSSESGLKFALRIRTIAKNCEANLILSHIWSPEQGFKFRPKIECESEFFFKPKSEAKRKRKPKFLSRFMSRSSDQLSQYVPARGSTEIWVFLEL